MTRALPALVLVAVACAVVMGCGTTGLEGSPDATTDPRPDSLDAGTDAECTFLLREKRSEPGCTGDADDCSHYYHNSAGVETSYTINYDCDEDIEVTFTREYDDEGRQIRVVSDTPEFPDTDLCWIYRYDDAGNLIMEGSDLGCDGSLDHSCDEYHWTGDDLPAEWNVDDDCDGSMETCRNYLRDDEGELFRFDLDEGCDGSVDKCWLYEPGGELHGFDLLTAFDEGCDGVLDTCFSYEDVPGGRYAQFIDDGCDGSCNRINTYEPFEYRGMFGRNIRERDEGCDGVLEECAPCSVEYSDDGRTRTQVCEQRVPCDGGEPTCMVTIWSCL